MEFEDILKNYYSKPKSDYNFDNQDMEKVVVERDKIKELAIKLLSDFDKVNTKLRDVIAERDKLKEENHNLRQECIHMNNEVQNAKKNDAQRKDLYNETTSLRRERTAYAKAIGAIYGALEELTKTLN